ncbi:zinc finger and BTB domain-containing protein 47-like isoform X1 [Lethenteron reissneri]|uniref:zinc finger and BTB domain-containing protein 47-like isoform X1 n=1 Tax=Lethenteron reissneri TaxID=7753 RepID=UPI002AB63166|nr:zinc finger and BTB domain-containing protein 47-like isoform X1 [Lethenteron reissneri]
MAALCAEAVLDPREDFPAWLGAHGVSARVLEAVEAELGIGDYEALLACAAQAPVRAELLAAAKERLPFAFYAALRRVAEQVGRGAGGCGGGAGGCGAGHHDGSPDALALHPFLGSLLDTIVRMLSNLSRELSHSAERFRLLDAAAFYGHGGGGADDDRDTRLSSPGHSVQDADGYGEDGADASALDMDEDGLAPDGTAAAVVRWSRGVSSASLHDGALQPPDPHVAAVGPSAGGAGEAEADDAAGAADAWRAASVKTEPLHEGEKSGAAEGSLACELDEASAFCQGAVETQDDDYDENDDDDIDDNDDRGGGATPGRAPRWGSLERGAASWAERAHEPPDRWPGNFHPPLPKLESSEGHGSDGAYAQQHSPPPPPPCSWQTADVTAAPRLDHTNERSRGQPQQQQQQRQLPAERFVRSDVECEGLACRAAYTHVYDDDVVVVTDEQLAHGGGNSPRVCPDCGMSFRTPSKLCRHRQSRHSEQKPYICGECGKRFSLIHNLNQHRRIHSGEKPFVCEECGMTFGRKYHLDRHKKTHSIH